MADRVQYLKAARLSLEEDSVHCLAYRLLALAVFGYVTNQEPDGITWPWPIGDMAQDHVERTFLYGGPLVNAHLVANTDRHLDWLKELLQDRDLLDDIVGYVADRMQPPGDWPMPQMPAYVQGTEGEVVRIEEDGGAVFRPKLLP